MACYKQIEWNDENVARFWDYTSQFPELYFTYQFGHLIIKRLKKYLGRGGKVLDYGCGTGFLIPHLLKLGFNVTGLDFSQKSVECVNKKFGGQKNFSGAYGINEVLAKNEKFNAIILIEVIEHLSDEYLEQTVENVKRLLEEDGIVIFTTPNEEKLSDSEVFCPDCERVFHKWQHVRSWNSADLSAYMRQRGLNVIGAFTTDFSASFLKRFMKKIVRPKSPHLICICKNQKQ